MTENSDRGKIYKIKLKMPIIFNGHKVTHVIIELDHINYGLDKKSGGLNTKKRTSFSNKDIEKFIKLLDGEAVVPERRNKLSYFYYFIIRCPIKGKFENKEFLMIFKMDRTKTEELHTITLIPNWKTEKV